MLQKYMFVLEWQETRPLFADLFLGWLAGLAYCVKIDRHKFCSFLKMGLEFEIPSEIYPLLIPFKKVCD